jgi:hypothetical protein
VCLKAATCFSLDPAHGVCVCVCVCVCVASDLGAMLSCAQASYFLLPHPRIMSLALAVLHGPDPTLRVSGAPLSSDSRHRYSEHFEQLLQRAPDESQGGCVLLCGGANLRAPLTRVCQWTPPSWTCTTSVSTQVIRPSRCVGFGSFSSCHVGSHAAYYTANSVHTKLYYILHYLRCIPLHYTTLPLHYTTLHTRRCTTLRTTAFHSTT